MTQILTSSFDAETIQAPDSREEIERRFWHTKLTEFEKKKFKTKIEEDTLAQLLKRLPKNNLDNIAKTHREGSMTAFLEYRKRLVSRNHGNGLSWSPRTGLFWRFIGLFIKISPKGSALYQILQLEPGNDSDVHGVNPSFSQLSKPHTSQQIVHNLERQIESLTESSNEEDIDAIFDDLKSLRPKFTGELTIYSSLLRKIAEKKPNQTLVFLKSLDFCPFGTRSQDFMELHFLIQILMKHVVCRGDANQHIFNIRDLLYLLTSDQFLKEFITKVKEAPNTSIGETFDIFMGVVGQKTGNFTQIKEQAEKTAEKTNTSFVPWRREVRIEDAKNDTLYVLEDFLSVKAKSDDIDVLTFHFSRIAMEQLLLDYIGDKQLPDDMQSPNLWKYFPGNSVGEGGGGYALMKIISDNILNTPGNTSTLNHYLSKKDYKSILASEKCPCSLYGIEKCYVIPFIFAMKTGGEKQLQKKYEEILVPTRNERSRIEIDWILYRLEQRFPDEEAKKIFRSIFLPDGQVNDSAIGQKETHRYRLVKAQQQTDDSDGESNGESDGDKILCAGQKIKIK